MGKQTLATSAAELLAGGRSSRAAAAPTCSSSSKLQKQQATATNKQKCGLSCAPRHPLQSVPPQREDRPHLLRCPLRPRPSRTATNDIKKKQAKHLFQIIAGRHVYCSPMSTIDPNRLGILSSSYLHNHQASSAVSAPPRPRQGSTGIKAS